MRFLTLVISLLLIQTSLTAQERKHFRIEYDTGSSNLDEKRKGNVETIEKMLTYLEEATARPDITVTRIGFHGSVSPEGPSTLNHRLSLARLYTIEQYVRRRVHIPDSILTRNDDYISWRLLEKLIKETGAEYQDTVLGIIKTEKSDESKRNSLKSLDSGKVWNDMKARFFPTMRNSGVIIITTSNTTNLKDIHPQALTRIKAMPVCVHGLACTRAGSEWPVIGGITADAYHHASTGAGTKCSADTWKTDRNFCIGLKTNLLYDAMLVPDAGIEFALGKDWSLNAGWTYAWWRKDSAHKYWRVYGGNAGARWWFGRRHADAGKLTGHHIGIEGGAFTFDFETGRSGYMGGKPGGRLWDQTCWSAGLEYGYSLPIAGRLNIDFSISAGYTGGKYYKYKPEDGCYAVQKESRLRYFGPERAEVSLVWILGNRKGGAR